MTSSTSSLFFLDRCIEAALSALILHDFDNYRNTDSDFIQTSQNFPPISSQTFSMESNVIIRLNYMRVIRPNYIIGHCTSVLQNKYCIFLNTNALDAFHYLK